MVALPSVAPVERTGDLEWCSPRRRWQPLLGIFVSIVTAWSVTGCVKAPSTVYLVDQKTVLEQQAGGELRGLVTDLDTAAMQPRPAPLTPAQLEAAGVSGGGLSTVAQFYITATSDADRIDALLIRRCLGEARTGLLEITMDTCTGTVDFGDLTRLVQRENRNRRQIWAYIQQQRPGVTEQAIRTTWHKNHLTQVVCQGQIQRDDGTWTIKACETGRSGASGNAATSRPGSPPGRDGAPESQDKVPEKRERGKPSLEVNPQGSGQGEGAWSP